LDEIGLVVYEEMSFKVKVYGRTDGRRTKSDHKSSPCHFVTGELKRCLKPPLQQFLDFYMYNVCKVNNPEIDRFPLCGPRLEDSWFSPVLYTVVFLYFLIMVEEMGVTVVEDFF
jgi:hypothetical protein